MNDIDADIFQAKVVAVCLVGAAGVLAICLAINGCGLAPNGV